MKRPRHDQELVASHARAQAERRDENPNKRRARLVREIDHDLKDLLRHYEQHPPF